MPRSKDTEGEATEEHTRLSAKNPAGLTASDSFLDLEEYALTALIQLST